MWIIFCFFPLLVFFGLCWIVKIWEMRERQIKKDKKSKENEENKRRNDYFLFYLFQFLYIICCFSFFKKLISGLSVEIIYNVQLFDFCCYFKTCIWFLNKVNLVHIDKRCIRLLKILFLQLERRLSDIPFLKRMREEQRKRKMFLQWYPFLKGWENGKERKKK